MRELNNRLIAEFMELDMEVSNKGIVEYYHLEFDSGEWYEAEYLPYDEWNWLMPVANEIIKSRDEQNADWDLTDLKYALCSTNIEYVYNAVVEFIKWYNNQSK